MPRRDTELAAILPQLTGVARRLTRSRDEAEDLVQETILRVWSRLAEGGEVRALRPYLFATLRNLACRTAVRPHALSEADTPWVASDAEGRLAAEDVLRAIRELPREQAILLRGLAVEGASYADLARRYRLPLGTVMSRVSRGRAHLTERLGLPREAPVAALIGDGFRV